MALSMKDLASLLSLVVDFFFIRKKSDVCTIKDGYLMIRLIFSACVLSISFFNPQELGENVFGTTLCLGNLLLTTIGSSFVVISTD